MSELVGSGDPQPVARSEQAAASAGRRVFGPRVARLPDRVIPAVAVVCWQLAAFWAPVLVPAAGLVVIAGWAGWALPLVLAGTVVLLWLSFVVHEAGHVVAFRLLAPSTGHVAVADGGGDAEVAAYFVVDRTGAGVHRPRLRRRWREAVVVLAGPCAPVLVWMSGVVVGYLAAGGVVAAAVVWTGIVAWGHPVALLVPVGDTRALLDLRRSR